MYLLQLQIEETSRRLRTGDLGIPPNPEERSPSPEPIYNHEGKRLNTREYRMRKKLEELRHELVQKALKVNSNYHPPSDYKPPVVRVSDKVLIPQEEHPDINFVGLLIGPRGNTLKTLEKDTGAKIIIRGKGSIKEGKVGRSDGQPLPGQDEPLHAYITANNPENVKSAAEKIKDIIRQGIEVPEGQNDLRRHQLRELALLNGTLRETDGLSKLRQMAQANTIVTNNIVCTMCGGAGHIAQDCKERRPGETLRQFESGQVPMPTPADKAKMDSEYMSLMAELGETAPPPPGTQQFNGPPPTVGQTWNRGGPMALPPPPPPPGNGPANSNGPPGVSNPWQQQQPPPPPGTTKPLAPPPPPPPGSGGPPPTSNIPPWQPPPPPVSAPNCPPWQQGPWQAPPPPQGSYPPPMGMPPPPPPPPN